MPGKTILETPQARAFVDTMDALSRKKYAKMKADTDAHLAAIRAEPGYEEVLAEVRSEVESASLLTTIIEKSNLSQREIARRMNVSQPYVAQLKKGRKITLPTLFRLADACGIHLRISAAAAL